MDEEMRRMIRELRDKVSLVTYAVQGATHVAAILLANSTFDMHSESDVAQVMDLLWSAGGIERESLPEDIKSILMTQVEEHFKSAHAMAVEQNRAHKAGECGCQQPSREQDARAPSVEETKRMFGYL